MSGSREISPGEGASVSMVAESLDDLSLLDQDARALVEAAAMIADAETADAVGRALAHNLHVWIAIKTIVNTAGNPLPAEIRANFDRLAAYVVRTTLGDQGQGVNRDGIESLVRIDLHIADGLMRSQRNRLIRERAHQIWEDAGRPEGLDKDHWLQAEQEILALLAAD